MTRTYLDIGQSKNIATRTIVNSAIFARNVLLLLNVIARGGRFQLAALAAVAILALAGCENQNSEPEFCFTVTGEARESDQKAVEDLWRRRSCNSKLNSKTAGDLLKAARVDRMKRLGIRFYNPETPSGTDTRAGAYWLSSMTEICVSAKALEDGGICPQEEVVETQPCPQPQKVARAQPDGGGTKIVGPKTAPVDQQLSEEIRQARKNLKSEISKSESLINRLKQNPRLRSSELKLTESTKTARGIYYNEKASLAEINRQVEKMNEDRNEAKRQLNILILKLRKGI